MITPTRTTPSRRKVENYLVARIEKGIEVVLVAIDVSGCKVWSDAPIRELRKSAERDHGRSHERVKLLHYRFGFEFNQVFHVREEG